MWYFEKDQNFFISYGEHIVMKLPVFNYPSTILWVDDDALFLRAVNKVLSKKYLLKTLSTPEICLEFFKTYKPLLVEKNFFRGCHDHDDYDTAEHFPIDLDISSFSDIQNHSERHQEISVMVVDYNMPKMNGLELCRALQHLPMKKILLTGQVEHVEAVAAFNEGIIDRFIRKDSKTLVDEIQMYLDALIKHYFRDNTQSLLSHLETDQKLPLSDPIFVSFFENWCEQNYVREHFVIDKQGNICVINKEGVASHFVVHTDRSLAAFLNVYDDIDRNRDLIEAVVEREKIPFFGVGKDGWQVAVEKWEGCFYKPNLLEGRERYFWCVLNNEALVA